MRHERFHRSAPPPLSLSGQAGLLWKMRLGVTDGVRTRDNRNHNPALYQLSYGHPQTHWAEKRKPALARPAWRALTGILAFRPKPWRSLSLVVESFGRPSGQPRGVTLYSHLGFDLSPERTTFRVSPMSPICRYRLSARDIHSGARVAFRACERLLAEAAGISPAVLKGCVLTLLLDHSQTRPGQLGYTPMKSSKRQKP